MNFLINLKKCKKSNNDLLEYVLILLSSILLGIWAVKGTIALRNILLASGALLSLYYILRTWKDKEFREQLTTLKVLPFFLLSLAFVWIIVHYIFFSVDSTAQLKELKSTWMRAFLSSIVGLGTGLALRNHTNRLNLLWLGVLIAFLILFYQYLPRALAQDNLLVTDYDHYLFHLKINTVLMGMILISGVNGALLDHLHAIQYSWRDFRFWYLFYGLLGNGIALWAFVYIVDSLIGIGLSILLYGFWLFLAVIFVIKSQICRLNLKSVICLLIVGISFALIVYLAFLQTKINQVCHELIEDAKIAIQIDRYTNWQNIPQLGYPKRQDGQLVKFNTYERVAWLTAGSRAIIASPLGVGVLAYPFEKHPNTLSKMILDTNIPSIATHSGWVELGLAFGIPILGLIFSILLLTYVEASRYTFSTRMTVMSFALLILCFYTVGELAIKHGIEILFYLLALIPALLLTKSGQNGKKLNI